MIRCWALVLCTVMAAMSLSHAARAQETLLSEFQAIANAQRAQASVITTPGAIPRSLLRRRLAAAVSARAIDAIALAPARTGEIAHAAATAAPEVADDVGNRIIAAFPAYAGTINAALGRAPAAAPMPRAMTPAARHMSTPTFRGPQSSAREIADRRRRANVATADLIAAIASDPRNLEAAVQRALAAAPQSRDVVLRNAADAYPGYAGRIAAAAGGRANPSTPARHQAPRRDTATPPAYRAVQPVAPADDEPPRHTPAPREEVTDPIEPVNRVILKFNDAVDFLILRPIAWTYNKITPDPVILAVRRFFLNLKSPVILANDILQFTLDDAATTIGRFGVNSTIGFLGFFDPASSLGLPRHVADFGQTMHAYGAGPGPYVVVPILGPSTARDGVGSIVDIFFDPLHYLLPTPANLGLTGAKALSVREELLDPIDELRESSIDFYGALRSAYYQRRAVELGKSAGGTGIGASAESVDTLFDSAQ